LRRLIEVNVVDDTRGRSTATQPEKHGGEAMNGSGARRPRGSKRGARRGRWLGVLALCGLLVGLGLVLYQQDRDRVLWRAGASRPLIDEWASFTEAGRRGATISSTSRPSRISQVTKKGRRAYKFTVLAGDRDHYTTNAQRTELGQGNPSRDFSDGTGGRQMRAGQERWVAERILIPRGAPTGDSGDGFFVVNQFKMAGPGGPAVALSFEENRLVVSRAEKRVRTSAGSMDLGRTPVVPRDRWVSILWHIRWSQAGDGLIEFFADLDGKGLRRFVRYRGWTLKRPIPSQPLTVHPRIGIYRRTIRRDTSIYFSGFDVAKSRAGAASSAGL
jgi:hypothetical protein